MLALNEVNSSLDGGDSLNFIIGDLNVELLLQTHDKLNGIQRVGTQIIHEGGTVFEGTVGVQLVLDKLTNLLLNTVKGGDGAGGHVGSRGEGGGRADKGGEDEGLGL